MKEWILSIALLLACQLGFSQQLATFSQFRNFQYILNPGAVYVFEKETDGDILDIDVAYRAQWTGIDGAPSTATIGGQYILEDQSMSLGAFLINDQFGPTDYTQIGIQYAYQIRFDRKEFHFLSIGLSATLSQHRVQFGDLDVISLNDDLLQAENESRMSPDLSLGIYYQKKLGRNGSAGGTYLFAGLSADQLFRSDIVFEGGGNLKREIVVHVYSGMRFYYDRRGYDYVEPVVWVRGGVNTPVHADLGCRASLLTDKIVFGAAVGTDLQSHLMAQMNFESFSIGYCAGIFLRNTLGGNAGMSHEVTIGYRNVFW